MTSGEDVKAIREALNLRGVASDQRPYIAADAALDQLVQENAELKEAYTRLVERLRYATPKSLVEVTEREIALPELREQLEGLVRRCKADQSNLGFPAAYRVARDGIANELDAILHPKAEP